ncbi:MAG: type III pantothenate kinase [Woeseia sp.]
MSLPTVLLFDIGNTRIKWGVLEKNNLVRTGSIAHEKLQETGFSAMTTRLPRKVNYVLASNVAGQSFATRFSGVIGIHCNLDVHFAHAEREACGVTNSYRTPRRIGVDRWVAMIGARGEFRGALCVVDAGTAVTIDALDGSGQHQGGMIVPGMAMMASSLHANTGEIPLVRVSRKSSASGMDLFARTTDGAVQMGALCAITGAIERAVGTLRRAGLRPKVILTGGDASRILTELDDKVVHRPHLVLQGLARMVPNAT